MPIIKDIQAPTGATTAFHKVLRAVYDVNTGSVSIDVASWASEADYLASKPLVWSWPVDASPTILSNIDAGVATIAPFDGGTVVVDDHLSLSAVKMRASAYVNAARQKFLDGGFTWTDTDNTEYKFDSDLVSQLRVIGSAEAAREFAIAGTPFNEDWILFDNSVHTFTGAQMIAIGLKMRLFIKAAISNGAILKAQINAAATNTDAQAIVWITDPSY